MQQLERVAAATGGQLAEDLGIGVATGHQYLTFALAGESYGVDILRVQEIKGWTPVTRVPNTPTYVQGVLNLRGAIVPIIDLRMRFGLEQVEYSKTTVVIVLAIRSRERERVVGIVVDAVSDVLSVEPSLIKETPDFGAAVDNEFITGLATIDEQMVMLLDIDRMLSEQEIHRLEQIG